MEYRKFDSIIIARIDNGEEILEKVKEIYKKKLPGQSMYREFFYVR